MYMCINYSTCTLHGQLKYYYIYKYGQILVYMYMYRNLNDCIQLYIRTIILHVYNN